MKEEKIQVMQSVAVMGSVGQSYFARWEVVMRMASQV